MFNETWAQQINDLLREEYAKIPEAEEANTATLSLAVLKRLDPDKVSPPLVNYAAFLEMKQMARAICRRRHAEQESLAESGNLFDFQLQARYPVAGDTEEDVDVYRPLASMLLEDFDYNINRLEAESKRKHLHAEALRQERDARIRRGTLVTEVSK